MNDLDVILPISLRNSVEEEESTNELAGIRRD